MPEKVLKGTLRNCLNLIEAARVLGLPAVVSEQHPKGLGRTLLQAQVRLNAELLFAAIGYLTILGLFFYGLVDVIERLAIPWHISKRGNKIRN